MNIHTSSEIANARGKEISIQKLTSGVRDKDKGTYMHL